MVMTRIPLSAKSLLGVVMSLALLLSAACGGGGGGGSASGTGTLAVRMSDAPDPTISALTLTISRVRANVDGQWIDIENDPATLNVLDLAQDDVQLGAATVPAGDVSQIRLYIASATVTDSTGTYDVEIPSAAQTGLKINVHAPVSANEVQTILLDFNVDKSLIKTGNGQYKLQPVIPAVVQTLSGTVTGSATDGTNVLNNVHVTAVYEAGDSYPVGTEVNTSSTLSDGMFKLWALLPGTYTLNFSWTDPNDATIVKTATVTGVQVTANQNTDVGAVTLS
jgi:hypothetical protein